mmetsp:Transcript_9714/g.20722  ORF Transcript_9714/g.20722 Transcript_9714/m.20722 type:complete len:295 (+) Transcript_9714:176-1060(+)|eukprot:CAMPEP_0202898600 /NCGR_PEP_ID=MMETSP1392-20130828/7083_1 /ASSEMBLY_ACC=CAM_ASM_000868 /TAXON_ID=225041 /ORGANISM="Chlamydomonas chlamydogama, Strain SAG 11-48b" /LENGTH=294 /DNA_ID=CAMNT_0049584579 /DNA_START=120 /DNA_END=1004 /DNA_ORIENTATION=-
MTGMQIAARHAEIVAKATQMAERTMGLPEHSKRDLMLRLLTSHNCLPQDLVYAMEYDWELEPGQTHMGKGDLLFTNAQRTRFLVVAVRHITTETGKTTKRTAARKQVRQQALQVRGGFMYSRAGVQAGAARDNVFAAVYTSDNPSKVVFVVEDQADETTIRQRFGLEWFNKVERAPLDFTHMGWVAVRMAGAGGLNGALMSPVPTAAAIAAAAAPAIAATAAAAGPAAPVDMHGSASSTVQSMVHLTPALQSLISVPGGGDPAACADVLSKVRHLQACLRGLEHSIMGLQQQQQ